MSNNVLGSELDRSRLLGVSPWQQLGHGNRLWTSDIAERQTVLSLRLLYNEHTIYHSGCENAIEEREKEGQMSMRCIQQTQQQTLF